jgi:hypothetical protein
MIHDCPKPLQNTGVTRGVRPVNDVHMAGPPVTKTGPNLGTLTELETHPS